MKREGEGYRFMQIGLLFNLFMRKKIFVTKLILTLNMGRKVIKL